MYSGINCEIVTHCAESILSPRSISCAFENLESESDFKQAMLNLSAYSLTDSVEKIIIRSSNITEFPKDAFYGIRNLQDLTASDIGMEVLTVSVLSLSRTRRMNNIDMSKNLITEIPNRIFNNFHLTNLNLSHNKISKIEDLAFKGMVVENLYLNDNQIKSIQFLIQMALPYKLDISRNMMETLDLSNLSGDTNYEHYETTFLANGNNDLVSVKCESSNWFKTIELTENSKLKEVDFDNCGTELNLSKCEGLESIMVGGFERRTRRLILSDCKLTRNVTDQVLKLNVYELDLTNNTIGKLEYTTFSNLEYIEKLILKSTQISSLDFGMFPQMKNLKSLDISYNGLKDLDLLHFYAMRKLGHLDIAGNDLKTILNIEEIRNVFPSLMSINLSNIKFDTCYALIETFKIIHKYGIEVDPAEPYERESKNIQGIACEL